MKLPELYDGRILSRYKRFLADVTLDSGETVTVHCPNTGAMTGCWAPQARCQISHSDNPRRKLPWTLERVDMGQGWVGVNTNRVNSFIRDFLDRGLLSELGGYREIRSEPVYRAPDFAASRFDFLLQDRDAASCFVEVKNTTLYENGRIQFPDTATPRGTKHLHLLEHAVENGYRGVMLYAVNRPEGDTFSPARQLDPRYYEQLISAHHHGVEIIALRIQHHAHHVEPGERLVIAL